MRVRMCLVAAVVLACLSAVAAPPGSPAAPDQRHLDQLLRQWEQHTRSIRDVFCEFKVETLDAVFREHRTEYGRAWGLKPYYGRLDLRDQKGNWRIFISTGKAVHQYESRTKQEIVHVLPTGSGKDKMLPGGLSFIFGMTAAEAKRRFDLHLYKETDQYAWIRALPRTELDRRDFVKAELVFSKKTYLPQQIKIVEPNRNQQIWMFTRLETNVNPPITKDKLAPLKVPVEKGWKTIVNRWDQTAMAPAGRPASRPPGR